MSTDEETRRIVAAAHRIGINLAQRHVAAVDNVLASTAALTERKTVNPDGAIAGWSAYLGHIVAHMSLTIGLSREEIVQQLSESIGMEGASRAN